MTQINSQRLLAGSASHRSSGMTLKRFLGIAALALALPVFASAQTDDAPVQKGKELGAYNVQQSVEFGGRFTSGFGGNASMYNTLVNLKSGVRLLDQSLSMRSIGGSGLFFDSLTESATGFGGDPNQVARFQMSKNKWYNLSAQYRHDQYYSDFNLLANSLAVPNSTNFNVFNSSPHFMNTARSFGDINLKLLPQSWMSFRLGYSQGKDQGPAYTTVHSPGDLMYLENFSTRSRRYKVGVDVKPFARTQFSYDFAYERDRNDIAGVSDANAVYLLGSTGLLVDPGVSYDPFAGIISTCGQTAGNHVNGTCYGFLAYARTQPIRTDLPTHQVSFVSNYFSRVDLSGSASYTGGSSKNAAYNETWTRYQSAAPAYAQYAIQGNSAVSQITGNADFKATVHITKSWSFDEKFRWVNWRNPEAGLLTNTLTSALLNAGNVMTPATLPAPASYTQNLNYFAENSKYDTMQLNYRPSSKFGAWVGYKIGLREITDNTLANTLAADATTVTKAGTPASDYESEMEHHALLGVSVRPVEGWQIRAQADLMSADGAYTLITPRHEQNAKVDTSYDFGRLATIAGSAAFDLRSNDGYAAFPTALQAKGEQYKSHTNFFDVSLALHPTRTIDVDLGVSNEKIYEHAPQCVPLNMTGWPASFSFGTNVCQYPATGASRPTAVPLFSRYQEDTTSGYIMLVLKPVHRVTVNLGYDITSNSGYQNWLRADTGAIFQLPVDATGSPVVKTTQTQAGTYAGLYPWMPLGSLAYNYHRPMAGVTVDLAKGLIFKGGFNNYDYNEKGAQIAPVAARDFHGNVVTLSLKHWF